jgi:hypothetical protein
VIIYPFNALDLARAEVFRGKCLNVCGGETIEATKMNFVWGRLLGVW